ncbi:MAG: hypothetical protein ACK5LC_18265 [Coprobacillaceae bacterium]
MEGFLESLQHELRRFNIQVKIIEPGVINTDFYGRSMDILENADLHDYQEYSSKVTKNILSGSSKGSHPDVVAKTIYKAATDNKKKLRYLSGKSKELAILRKIFPYRISTFLVRKIMEN